MRQRVFGETARQTPPPRAPLGSDECGHCWRRDDGTVARRRGRRGGFRRAGGQGGTARGNGAVRAVPGGGHYPGAGHASNRTPMVCRAGPVRPGGGGRGRGGAARPRSTGLRSVAGNGPCPWFGFVWPCRIRRQQPARDRHQRMPEGKQNMDVWFLRWPAPPSASIACCGATARPRAGATRPACPRQYSTNCGRSGRGGRAGTRGGVGQRSAQAANPLDAASRVTHNAGNRAIQGNSTPGSPRAGRISLQTPGRSASMPSTAGKWRSLPFKVGFAPCTTTGRINPVDPTGR